MQAPRSGKTKPDLCEEFYLCCGFTTLAKFAVADSRRWTSFLLDILPRLDNVNFAALPDKQKRMLL